MPSEHFFRGDERIIPGKLPVDLDPGLLRKSFYELEEAFAGQQGLSDLASLLEEKAGIFREVLGRLGQPLTERELELLVERMFTARRKIWPAVIEAGAPAVTAAIQDLLAGYGDLRQRLQRFEEAIPASGKARRALRDVGAELLHFSDPARYPFMPRWVWHQETTSGAVREYVRGGDYLTEFPLGDAPEMFEGVRQWMRDVLEELGVYRNLPFIIDMLLAYQYSQYLRAMAEGFLRSDFGGQSDFTAQIRNLLGVETRRRLGGTRIRRDGLH